MSKMDNLRAMREAKYAAAQRRSESAPARPAARPPVAPPAAIPSAQVQKIAVRAEAIHHQPASAPAPANADRAPSIAVAAAAVPKRSALRSPACRLRKRNELVASSPRMRRTPPVAR